MTMKRAISLIAVLCLFWSMAFAVGSVTETVDELPGARGYVVTFSWTGDSADGSVPSTATAAATNIILKGMFLYMVETNPGSTAPTDNYDIVLNNAGSVDLMAGAMANRDTANTEIAFPTSATPSVDTAITMVLTNQSVNSATGTVKMYFSRLPTGGSTSSSTTVGGPVATNAAATGNPVPVGGTYNSSPITLDNLDRSEVQVDVNGYMYVHPTGTDVAHDAADAGNPVKIGAKAVAHGTNPTGVAAADRTDLYANRAGVLFVMGGHPNAVTATYLTTGAQTDDNVMPAIAGGTKYVITRVTVTLDEATTVGTAFRLGFGATVVPALGASAADAVVGILVYHPGLVPGAGWSAGDGSGILAIGGDGEELRITCEAPTTGTLVVSVTYYTIES